jgi:hypothetical protein
VKACVFLLLALYGLNAQATDRYRVDSATLKKDPTTWFGRAPVRNLASYPEQELEAQNKTLFDKLKPGSKVIIMNSTHEFEDNIARVVDKFEDGSVRVELTNGKRYKIRGKNLSLTVSPEVKCGKSFATDICKGDKVFYPSVSTSLYIPEAPVEYVFENGAVVVKDGAAIFILDLQQVGKAVDCSPQKMSLCKGDYVMAEGYRNNARFDFEGTVEQAYTHGLALIKSDGFWLFPIDVGAVSERTETEQAEKNPAVITSSGSRVKQIPYRVTEEIEPNIPGLKGTGGPTDEKFDGLGAQ